MTRKDDDEPVGVLDERSLEDSLERQLADDAEPEPEPEPEPGSHPETGSGPRYGHAHEHEHEHEHEPPAAAGMAFTPDRTRPAPTVPVFVAAAEVDDVGGDSQEAVGR